jgi:hypothetical protein
MLEKHRAEIKGGTAACIPVKPFDEDNKSTSIDWERLT